MSVCVEAERGERLATDNPENTLIHSDFHTINHRIMLDRRQSGVHRSTRQRQMPNNTQAGRRAGLRLVRAK